MVRASLRSPTQSWMAARRSTSDENSSMHAEAACKSPRSDVQFAEIIRTFAEMAMEIPSPLNAKEFHLTEIDKRDEG